MSNREFTAHRTMLANAFATAGAELLEYMGVSSALAAIPNTEPPQYVVAGTLLMIAKALPPVSAVEQPTGDLTDEQIIKMHDAVFGWLDDGYKFVLKFARDIESAAIAAHLARQPKAEQPQATFDIGAMVNRFLGWKLPQDFYPDAGISFTAPQPPFGWPTGTNLLHAGQAKAMFEYCLKDAARPTDDHLWTETLRDRDMYHEWADKLAEAIAKHFGVDIGEHSNMNCPWSEALDAIEYAHLARQAQAEPVAQADAPHARLSSLECELIDLNKEADALSASLDADIARYSSPVTPSEQEGEQMQDQLTGALYALRHIAAGNPDPVKCAELALKVIASLADQVAPAGAQNADLHNAIMNIPHKRADSEFMNAEHRMLYKHGHRDARHAAAELAIAHKVLSAGAQNAEAIRNHAEGDKFVSVGTLAVYEDKDATFGYAYDISTNMAGHKALQELDGATLFVLQTGSANTQEGGAA